MKIILNVILLASLLCQSFAIAQTETADAKQEELSDDLQTALAEITEKDIKATIAFLASDELEGRDTPSRGLTVASSYIAARFQGAGLEGGAKDGSFYQVHEIATTQVPSDGITATIDGKPFAHYGLLYAGAEAVEFNGMLDFVSHEDEDWRQRKFEGAVHFVPKPFTGPRDLPNLIRQLSTLRRNGATAVLLQVDEDNPLVGEARRALEPRMVNPRMGSGVSLTTLLVPETKLEGEVALSLPPQTSGKAEVRNVIGVLKGSDPELSKEAIIFSAHLDHVGRDARLADPIFNGADDDASGCTAVCEIADAYGALPAAPKRTLIFMTFWGEERGLLGSRHYAANPEWPLEKTIANINIEMVGRPEAGAHEKAWMTGWYQSDLGELMNDGAQRIGVRIFEHPRFSEMLYRASDNASFVDKGVIAHSFSAGSLHQDYHQPSDEWDRLDLRHMTKVTQGLFMGSLPLAEGEVTPKKAEKK